jgi:phosphoglycerate dehydrogenase-like enzyme
MSKYQLLFLPPDKSLTHQVFLLAYWEEIAQLTDATCNPTAEQYSEAELLDLIPDIDIYITGWQSPRFTKPVMERADNLKLLLHSTGTVRPYVSFAVFEHSVLVTTANSDHPQPKGGRNL